MEYGKLTAIDLSAITQSAVKRMELDHMGRLVCLTEDALVIIEKNNKPRLLADLKDSEDRFITFALSSDGAFLLTPEEIRLLPLDTHLSYSIHNVKDDVPSVSTR